MVMMKGSPSLAISSAAREGLAWTASFSSWARKRRGRREVRASHTSRYSGHLPPLKFDLILRKVGYYLSLTGYFR